MLTVSLASLSLLIKCPNIICSTALKHRRPVNTSEGSNLKKHADMCKLTHENVNKTGTQPKISDRLPRKFCKGFFRVKLLKWITCKHRPDTIIEDKDLIDVFTYLNPDATPPSRSTLWRDIKDAYRMTRTELKKLLHEYEGRFNLIFDCWTTPNGHEFLGVLVSFVHNGKLYVVILDMIEYVSCVIHCHPC